MTTLDLSDEQAERARAFAHSLIPESDVAIAVIVVAAKPGGEYYSLCACAAGPTPAEFDDPAVEAATRPIRLNMIRKVMHAIADAGNEVLDSLRVALHLPPTPNHLGPSAQA